VRFDAHAQPLGQHDIGAGVAKRGHPPGEAQKIAL